MSPFKYSYRLFKCYLLLQIFFLAAALFTQYRGQYRLTDLFVYAAVTVNALSAVRSCAGGSVRGRKFSPENTGYISEHTLPERILSERILPERILPERILPERILCAALILTFCADTLLVLLDAHYAWGVFLFCCVQTLYAVCLSLLPGKDTYSKGGCIKDSCIKSRKFIILRAVLFAAFLCVVLAAGVLSGTSSGTLSGASAGTLSGTPVGTLSGIPAGTLADVLSPVTVLAVYSFSQLLANALQAGHIALAFRRLSDRLFAAGMILFLGCDICVGLRNMPLPHQILDLAFALNWIFYLPSQCLVTCRAVWVREETGDG